MMQLPILFKFLKTKDIGITQFLSSPLIMEEISAEVVTIILLEEENTLSGKEVLKELVQLFHL